MSWSSYTFIERLPSCLSGFRFSQCMPLTCTYLGICSIFNWDERNSSSKCQSSLLICFVMISMHQHKKLYHMYININEKLKLSYINTSPYLLTPRICGGCKRPNYKRFLLVWTPFNVRLKVKIDIYVNEILPKMYQILIEYFFNFNCYLCTLIGYNNFS